MDERELVDEDRLSAALEAIADSVEVSAVPLREIKAPDATGRRSWRALVLAAAAVVAVVGVGIPTGLAWWEDQQRATTMPGEVATPSPDDLDEVTGLEVAPGARLVGIGQVAIEVPAHWGTNDTRCGRPQRSTLVIDTAIGCHVVPRTQGIETIEMHPLKVVVDLVGEPVHAATFLGVDATRWETTCHDSARGVRVCTAQVWLHADDDVHVSATAATPERAEELLSTLRRTPLHVGLVGPTDFTRYAPGSRRSITEVAGTYIEHLRAQGLDPVLRTEAAPDDPGTTITVSPAPGTVLERGARVTVTLGAVGG